MNQPKASIILTTHNRYDLLKATLDSIFAQNIPVEVIVMDDGSTDAVPSLRDAYPIKYIRLDRPRPENDWCNPSLPINIGIKNATCDYVFVNGGEVRHDSLNFIQTMINELEADENGFVIATVYGEEHPGDTRRLPDHQYTGPLRKNAFFFSGIIRKKHLMEIGGWDEDYVMPGYDDNDMADRLQKGLKLTAHYSTAAIATHQWHPPSPFYHNCPEAHHTYYRKTCDWDEGKITHVRNVGREWGQLES